METEEESRQYVEKERKSEGKRRKMVKANLDETMSVDRTEEGDNEIVEGEAIKDNTQKKKQRNKEDEYIININNRLVEYSTLTDTEKEKREVRETRFRSSQSGEYIVTARLEQEQCSNLKKVNSCRIVRQVTRDQISPVKIIDSSFNTMDLYFQDMIKANKCLDIKDNSERCVLYTIENRTIRSKGVITGWTDKLKELAEGIDNPERVNSFERLRKRVFEENKGTHK